MYKKIILGIIIAILSLNYVTAGEPYESKEKIQIKLYLEKYINKFEKNNWKEKTLKLLKNVWIKLRKINSKYENHYWYNRDLYRYIWKEIYNLYLSKQDNTEKIVKNFSSWIYITQNKNWIWYTKIYAFWEMIYSQKTLNRVLCNYYSIFNCDYNLKNNYEIPLEKIDKIKEKALSWITYHNNWFSDDFGIKIITIWFYEWIRSYILDLNNKNIIKWKLQSITHFKKWKSWYYFFSEWYWNPILYYLDNSWNLKELYNHFDQSATWYLIDYELMTNKRVKLFLGKYEWGKTTKFEKIIKMY